MPLGRIWPPADLVALFLLQVVGLAAAASLLALRLGRFGCAMVAFALIGTSLAVVLRPSAPPLPMNAAAAGPELRVLFANLHRPTGTLPLAELERLLASFGADVVLLAEVSPDMMRDLARPERAFPAVAHCWGERHCETVILADRPLREVAYHVDAQQGGRVLAAEVEVAGVPVGIAVTHLLRPIPPGNQAGNIAQARFVASHLAERPRLVLGGDFNAVPWGRTMALLRANLGVEGQLLLGGTWPAWLPMGLRLPIDDVVAACGATVERIEAVRFPLSDHLAVLATVRVDAEATCPGPDLSSRRGAAGP